MINLTLKGFFSKCISFLFLQYHKNENKYKLLFLFVLFVFFKLQPFAFVETRPQDWVPVICSFVHTEAIELLGAFTIYEHWGWELILCARVPQSTLLL